MDQIEVIRRVWCDHGEADGAYLEIGPDTEGYGLIELRTADEISKNWFGDIRLLLSKEMATALGTALLASAKD